MTSQPILKVCDLKRELEERSLSTIGNKNALQLRLWEAQLEEGITPEIHLFTDPVSQVDLMAQLFNENYQRLQEPDI